MACAVGAAPTASATSAESLAPAACTTTTEFGAGQLSEIADDLSARETTALAELVEHDVDAFTSVVEDDAMWLDACGQLYAVDPAPAAADVRRAEQEPVADASMPLEDTFRLHSAPGASRTVYLDFLGADVDGKAWNRQAALGFTTPTPFSIAPYSIDDDTSTLSDTELASVQQIWSGVAEDFAPFDVDVTTERPSREALHRSTLTDDQYGLTVLIGAGGSVMDACGCGGIAWVDSYSMVGASADSYEYALVFTEGAGRSGEYLTSTISHEAGHTLGLQHDGVGTAGYYSGRAPWSPIMGAGSGPVTQWSRGEYSGASNQQDDLAVIAGHLPVVTDDHGDTVATATALPSSATGATTRDGVIGTSGDVDVFSFVVDELTESTTVRVAPRSLAGGNPNVKVRLDVLDASGALLHEARGTVTHSFWNGLQGMDSTWTGTLEPGLHHVLVSGDNHGDGVAAGTFSHYGSLGRYSVSVSGVTSGVLSVEPLSMVGLVGRPVSAQLVSSGGSGVTSWTPVGDLPAGLTLESDGRLHGVPTTATAASFTVRATSGRQQVTATVPWTVWATSALDVAATHPVTVTEGATVGYRIARDELSPVEATFAPCPTCEWPAWATLSTDGTATFTPPTAGVHRLGATLRAGDLREDVEFVVTATALTVPSPPAVTTTAGTKASWTLPELPDGPTWSLAAGPAWMQVSAAGVVSGVPPHAGRFDYVVRASSGAVRVEARGTVTVNPAVVRTSAPAVSVSATSGRPVNRSVASRSGLTWRVSAGRLPSGLRLSADGRVSGTAKQKSSTTVTVTGTSATHQVTRRVTFAVAAPVTMTASRRTLKVRRGTKATVTWRAARGTARYQFAVVGKLPRGMKLMTTARTAKVSGRPTRRGTHTVKVRVRDVHGSTVTRRVVVTVK